MKLMTKKETADYLKICLSSFQKIQNEIPSINLGRRRLYDQQDVDAYIEKKKQKKD